MKPFPGPGKWTGPGMVGDSVFNPSLIPSSTTRAALVYEYKGSNGCVGTKELRFAVREGVRVTAGSPITLCKNDKKQALVGNPTAWQYVPQTGAYYKIGAFSGQGVINP